jgi:hypothetical protein
MIEDEERNLLVSFCFDNCGKMISFSESLQSWLFRWFGICEKTIGFKRNNHFQTYLHHSRQCLFCFIQPWQRNQWLRRGHRITNAIIPHKYGSDHVQNNFSTDLTKDGDWLSKHHRAVQAAPTPITLSLIVHLSVRPTLCIAHKYYSDHAQNTFSTDLTKDGDWLSKNHIALQAAPTRITCQCHHPPSKRFGPTITTWLQESWQTFLQPCHP